MDIGPYADAETGNKKFHMLDFSVTRRLQKSNRQSRFNVELDYVRSLTTFPNIIVFYRFLTNNNMTSQKVNPEVLLLYAVDPHGLDIGCG